MKKIKIAVVGFGDRSECYTKYLRSHPEEAEVVAVVDPNPVRLSYAQNMFGLKDEVCFSDFDEFVKQGKTKKFVILDAGFTDLIRPAMYGAHHYTENLTASSDSASEVYDVVGPICESSDVFSKDELLPVTRRGDLIAFRSAGAYGEVMASSYNCRSLPNSYFSSEM